MKILASVLLVLLVGLQINLWFSEASLPSAWQIKAQIEQQEAENARILERNKTLQAEVMDLKRGGDAIEERARSELGMIREGETFFQIVENQAEKN